MSDTEKKDDKIQRILSIYTKLINGQIVNKDEEVLIHNCNARTFQRDIDDIRVFFDKQTHAMGIINDVVYDSKVKGYRLNQQAGKYLDNSEVLAICKILLDSRALKKNEMELVIQKLLDCCVPKQEQKEIKELISNELFHYVELQHKQSILKNMWEIGKAIRSHKYIEIEYLRTKDKMLVHRRLKPVAIMFSEFYFYLIALIDDEELREYFEGNNEFSPTIYRIDRIRSVVVREEQFVEPYKNRFQEGEFRKRIQFMYGGKLQKVKFEYSGTNVEAVLDRLPTAQILSESNGKYMIIAETFGDGIYMWLRSQGNNVRLIEQKVCT